MPGPFETAAGAFAVVGVADVVIRTGREIYGFLCNVADAPESMRKLRDDVQEISVVAQVCKQCLNKLKTRTQPVAATITPFDSALKSLDRELQRLKILIAKFNGGNTTWSRVKYVFDERKIEKISSSLERSKLLLANALVLAYGELSISEHQSIEALVQQCSQQVGLRTDSLAQLLTTTLDAHHQTFQGHNRTILANQKTVQEELAKLTTEGQQISAKSDGNHQDIVSKLDANEHNLSSVIKSQQQMSMKQTDLLRKSSRNQRQVASMSKKLGTSRNASTRNHKITRNMLTTLATKVEQLGTSSTDPSSRIVQSGREIYFLGERRDMIMAYLLSIKDHLKHAIDQILLQRIEGVSARHAYWLEREFGDLLGSAAQNEAARYSNSTATAFDQWSYYEDAIKSSGSIGLCKFTNVTGDLGKNDSKAESHLTTDFHSRLTRSRRRLVFNTSTGTLSISFPQDKTGSSELSKSDDIHVSFLGKSGLPFLILNASFFQKMISAYRSTICVQLNVFTSVPHSHHSIYRSLISEGSIGEIDAAIREGIINPYGMKKNMTGGVGTTAIVLLSLALRYGRVDLLDYLDRQGIGISQIRDDVSVWWGCFEYFVCTEISHETELNFDIMFGRIFDGLVDPLVFFARFALLTIGGPRFWWNMKGITYLMRSRLASRGYDLGNDFEWPNRPWDDDANQETEENWNLLPSRLRFLLEIILDDIPGGLVHLFWGQSLLLDLRQATSFGEPWFSKVVEEVLSIWLEKVEAMECHSLGGETMSMSVRRYRFWDEWRRALERYRKELSEVLRLEGNEWLERDDWRVRWIEMHPKNKLRIFEVEDESEDSDNEDEDYDTDFEYDTNEDSDDEEYQSEVLDDIAADSEQNINTEASERGEDRKESMVEGNTSPSLF